MGNILKATDEATHVIKRNSDPLIRDLVKDFPPKALELKGKHIVLKGGRWIVEEISLKELLWSEADQHGVFGLYYEKTLILNGKAHMGKSQLAKALARELAVRVSKDAFGYSTLCKYGAVTKVNQMHLLGCFVFDDFSLATRGKQYQLEVDEVKSLLYVDQPGHVPAFYSTAVFPEHIPRIWCMNYAEADNPSSWFHRENYDGRLWGLISLIDLLVSDDFHTIVKNEDQRAVARRAIIFNVDDTLYDESEVAEQSNAASLAYAEPAARTPFPAHFR